MRSDLEFPIVVSFAMAEEAGGLVDQLQNVQRMQCASFLEYRGRHTLSPGHSIPLLIVETGVGREKATLAAQDIARIYRPQWWLAGGFAAGLVDQLPACSLVLAEQIVDADTGNSIDTGLRAPPPTWPTNVHFGKIATVAHILMHEAEKRNLANTTNAIAADMESYSLAEVCRDQGIRFLATKIISDSVIETLPPEIADLAQHASWLQRLGAAASAVWARPAAALELWHLHERASDASHQLGLYLLQSVIPFLELAPPRGAEL